jgi:tetratricopeptide (TPR) repeat protein/KaiC/GvpD/RAD55 family RecA-like ATPase
VWVVSLKAEILVEPVLVGREQELAELEHHLKLATDGKGTTVFVSGEAGAGKTRLVTEFLKRSKKQGVTVLFGWCLSEAAVPYFPFIEAFNAYFGSFDKEEPPISLQQSGAQFDLGGSAQIVSEERGIAMWLTGARPVGKLGTPEGLSPQVWKDQAFAAVARTLHSISIKEPAILFIDDIQWADSASLALLHYLAHAIKNSERILVLATFRGEELTSCTKGYAHSLAEALCMMKREELFTEIKLSNLNVDSVSKIAENMIGGSLQKEFAEKLSKESQGNALFVVESLRMLSERKSLIQENNEWRLAVDELGIPSKVKDIILRRLSMLKHAQRRVLDAASVIGEKFDVELLSAVVGQDSLEVLETLSMIANSTSLVRAEGNFYRFDHAKSRETLYEEISLPLRRGYHNRIAEKLESNKNATLPLSDLAHHYAQAGNKEKATKYALEAGRDALEKFSNSQAINHFTYVLQAIGEDPNRSQERTIALEGLGDAYYDSNSYSEAIKTFEQLSDIATGVLKLRALRKALWAAFLQGNLPRMTKLMAKTEKYLKLDRLEAARIYQLRSALTGLEGKISKENSENIGKALRIFEEEYSLPDAAQILAAQGFSYALRGEVETGLAKGLLAVALFEEVGDLQHQLSAYRMLVETCMICGLFPETVQFSKKPIKIVEKTKLNASFTLAWIYSNLNGAFAFQGDFEQALSNTLKALEYAEKTDSALVKGMVYGRLVEAYVRRENSKLAEKYFQKLMKLPPKALLSGWVNLTRVKSFYFAGKKDWQESMRYFKENLDSVKTLRGPEGKGSPLVEGGPKMAYSWALARQGKEKEASTAMQEALKIFADAQQRFEHVNVYASFMTPIQVSVGQTFEARLDLVNASRGNGLLVEINNMLPEELQVTAIQPECTINGSSVQLKENKLEPFTIKTIKLTLRATKTGTSNLNPQAVYIDDVGQTKTSTPRPTTITAKPEKPAFEALPGRITTGYMELDGLLLGGIPENFGVVLVSPSIDERQLLIKRFLEAGAQAEETTFYITAEPNNGKALAEQYPSNFHLIVCNPQADAMVQNLPNVFKLKGVENLTEIDIALTKAFRTLDAADAKPKRACIEIVSDVLLQHHAVTTRKWLNGLLPTLKSKGFTTLAVINPQMHPQEEVHAILGLFEGEIRVSEKETPQGTEKILRIRKLYNQKYLENELALTREKLL